MNTEETLIKTAEKINEIEVSLASDTVLTKIAFAVKALKLNNKIEKTAAPTLGATMGRALVAGLGLGLAGEVLDFTNDKIKEKLFKKNMDNLIKEVKKNNPELKNTDNAKIKSMLEAGYKIAPDVIENPTIASSFVSIGNSLGGKYDPNTLKLFSEIQNKRNNGINRLSDSISPGLGIGANI
jgi:hypothetical protein